MLDGVTAAERKNVRTFALLADDRARTAIFCRLPVCQGLWPRAERLRPRTSDGPPTFYVHDKNAVLPNVAGRVRKLSWSVVEWTPNRYVVRVVAPSDAI